LVIFCGALQEWKELPFAPLGPVVEPPGVNRFLPKAPVDVIANGEAHDLPWMTGFTTDEGIYTASGRFEPPAQGRNVALNSKRTHSPKTPPQFSSTFFFRFGY